MSRETLSRAISGGMAVAALTIGGVGLSAASANAAPRDPWNAIAQCESGGNWSINTGNGYYGGLQFSASTWAAHGGHGSPANASKARQIAIGKRVVASQGWGAWASCSARLGLRGHVIPSVEKERRHETHAARTAHHEVAAHRTAREDRTDHTKRAERHHAGPRHAAHKTGRHVAAHTASGATYTVKSGDTLQGIAARLHVKGGWHALADASRLAHPDHIRPGQVLHLPAR